MIFESRRDIEILALMLAGSLASFTPLCSLAPLALANELTCELKENLMYHFLLGAALAQEERQGYLYMI